MNIFKDFKTVTAYMRNIVRMDSSILLISIFRQYFLIYLNVEFLIKLDKVICLETRVPKDKNMNRDCKTLNNKAKQK